MDDETRSVGAPSVLQRPISTDIERQPFIALGSNALAADGQTLGVASTRELLVNPPDVVHMHWPEHELGTTVVRRLRALAFLAALSLARRRGTRLVCTIHNAGPHDQPRRGFDRWFLETFDGMVDDAIFMSRAAIDDVLTTRHRLTAARHHHIRHGDFVPVITTDLDRVESKRSLQRATDRQLVVFAGQIRSYKGVPDLLRAAADVDVDVLVAGQCKDSVLASQVQDLAHANERATATFEYLSNERLSLHLRAADLVVLPYRQILNSGAAILALSAGRRILVPQTPTFDELAREVGPSWVIRYDGDLEPSDIADALAQPEPTGTPNLSLYAWAEISRALQVVYSTNDSSRNADPKASL